MNHEKDIVLKYSHKEIIIAFHIINLPILFKSALLRVFDFDILKLFLFLYKQSQSADLTKLSDDIDVDFLSNFSDKKLKEYLKKIVDFSAWDKVKNIIFFCENNNIDIIDFSNDLYPIILKNISDFPVLIFCKGNTKLLKKENALSIIGSRNASSYGSAVINDFIPSLVNKNTVIVSGMARGIDSLAHRSVLLHNGLTIAVLGTGVDVVYPKNNKKLYDEILLNSGLIISEFLPGSEPLKHHFPQRNRIIAGLSKGVLVVEAGLKSGTLITARLASDYSRDVFAVPGAINISNSFGVNNLMKNGAIITTSVNDILIHYNLEDKPIKANNNEKLQKLSYLSQEAKNIFSLIKNTPIALNDLIAISSMDFKVLLKCIYELENVQLIIKDDFGRYVRK